MGAIKYSCKYCKHTEDHPARITMHMKKSHVAKWAQRVLDRKTSRQLPITPQTVPVQPTISKDATEANRIADSLKKKAMWHREQARELEDMANKLPSIL